MEVERTATVSGTKKPTHVYCRKRPTSYLNPHAVADISVPARALLSTISYAEGTYNCYNLMFGHKPFYSYDSHPEKCHSYGRSCTTAAGRFQFLTKTWRGIAKKRGYTSFQPHFQDLGGLYLMKMSGVRYDRRYSKSSYRTTLRKIAGIWASLPGSKYGQPTKSFNVLWKRYTRYLR